MKTKKQQIEQFHNDKNIEIVQKLIIRLEDRFKVGGIWNDAKAEKVHLGYNQQLQGYLKINYPKIKQAI